MLFPEAHSEPSQISAMEHFGKNSLNDRLASKYASDFEKCLSSLSLLKSLFFKIVYDIPQVYFFIFFFNFSLTIIRQVFKPYFVLS